MSTTTRLRRCLLPGLVMPVLFGCGAFTGPVQDTGARSVEALFHYRDPGPMLRQAIADCSAGRRVLLLAAPSVDTMERLTMFSRVTELSPGCEIVTAKAPDLTGNPWTYVAWRPDPGEAQTHRGAPRPEPVEVQQLHGKAAQDALDGRAKALGCGPGQVWIQVFPPDIAEPRRNRVMTGLPSQAGCQKVEAYQDKIARPQGRISVVLGRRIRHLTEVAAPDATLRAEEPGTPRPRKASFSVLEKPVRFRNSLYLPLLPGGKVGARGKLYGKLAPRGPAIVAIFASWCTACLKDEELALVDRLARLAKARDVHFVNVADGQGEPRDEVNLLRKHEQARKYVYPIFVVPDRLAVLKDNVKPFEAGLPLFLIMSGRDVLAVRFGTLTDQVVVDLLEAALTPRGDLTARKEHLSRVLVHSRPPEVKATPARRPVLDIPEVVPPPPVAAVGVTPARHTPPAVSPAEPPPPKPVEAPSRPAPSHPEPRPKTHEPEARAPAPIPSEPATSTYGSNSSRTWGLVLTTLGGAFVAGAAISLAVGEVGLAPYDDMNESRVVGGGITQVEARDAGDLTSTTRVVSIGLGTLGVAALTAGVVLLVRNPAVRERLIAPSLTGGGSGGPDLQILPIPGRGAAVQVSF